MGIPNKIKSILNEIDKGIERNQEEYLLGLIEVDQDSYVELIDFTITLINKETFVLKEERNAIISLALVQFAIKEYNNGQFWNEFALRLNIEETNVIKISKESFETFCKMKDLYFHIGNINKGYVTSILVHAIIPNSSAHKFLEFLRDLYFKDLEEDYFDNEVEELIQYMHRLFSKFLEEDDISLVVQGSKMTIARQQLPKAFRIAFVKSASVVAPIIERLLFYIDQSNYGEFDEFLENDRFDKYFTQYEYSNRTTSTFSVRRPKGTERIKKFQVAHYYFEKRFLYLQIPKQIIDSEFIDNEIRLEILSQDTVMHSKNLLLTKSRLFFKTEPVSIQISQFSPWISYRIFSGNELIYDSLDLLHREFVIFDLEGNEITPKSLTDETVKIVTIRENEVLSDYDEINIAYESNYRITTVMLNEESILLINDKVLSTNTAPIRNELSSKHRYTGVSIIDDSKKSYDVYSNTPEVKIRIPYKKSIENFIVTINEKNFRLGDVSNYRTRILSDGSGDELGIIYIHDEILQISNPTSIIIREKGTNRIYIQENIFVLESLHYEFDKNYYYNDRIAKLINLKLRDTKYADNLKFPVEINLKNNDLFTTSILSNGRKFLLIIKIPKLSWRLGNNIHSYFNSRNYIWWEDISEYKLYIKCPGIPPKLHIITGSGYEQVEGKKVGDEIRYSLDHLFQLTNQERITLGIKIDGKEELITEIHFKPSIKDFFIEYYDNRHLLKGLYASWSFIGKGKLNIDIIYSPTQKIVKQYVLSENENLMDQDITLYYNEHEIKIYQVEEDDFFGEGSEKNILLWEKFIVGDPIIVSCKNKVLKGIHCMSDNEKYDLSNFYLKDIRFSSKKGYFEATGMYLINDRFTGKEREWYFTKHNPFLLKTISKGQSKITFEIVDRDGDGLIYDTISKHVNPKENGSVFRYKLIDSIIFEIMEWGEKDGAKSNKSIREYS